MKEKGISYTSKAVKLKDGNTAVWTDGVSIQCDHEHFCFYKFKPGRTYKITIEKV